MLKVKKNKSFSIFSVLLLILIMTGCSKKKQIQTLEYFNHRDADKKEVQENVKVELKELTKKEFDAKFNNISRFKRKKFFKEYLPLEIKISNNGNDCLILKKHSFILNEEYANTQKIETLKTKLEHRNKKTLATTNIVKKAGTSFLKLATAIFAIPAIASFPFAAAKSTVATTMLGLYSVVAIPTLAVIGVATLGTKGTRMSRNRSNRKIYQNLKENCIDSNKRYFIQKNKILKKILFVKREDLSNTISVKLFKESDDSHFIFSFSMNE